MWVTVQDGRAIRIEGDESAFQSMGHCCSKSQSSMQAAYHPDRLYYPMKRTAARGEDDPGWVRISWDEALATIAQKLRRMHRPLRRRGHLRHVGHEPHLGYMFRLLVPGASWWGRSNMAIPWQVCKGPRHWSAAMTSLFQGLVDGNGGPAEGVCGLGHGAGAFQLRRQLPHHGGRVP
ncbi:MAG: molybdopterin-dependent oxidoreductase [Adlercreutzia equolifaciens]